MTLFQSISIVFKKYAVFKGRASRSEFWWWQLFVMVLVVASAILECLVIEHTYGIITSMVSLILFLPYMAVSVRRCHDSSHTGWWVLCPIANIIMLFLPSEQTDNDYGVVNGVANANKPTEKILAGCSIALILPMLLLCVICVWLIFASSSVKLSADEAPYSTTEHLRELSGMTFLPSVKFIEGVRSNWDNDTHYYFEWENPLTEQDKQRILKYAKKSRYQQLWIYPETMDDNNIVVQKVLSIYDTPFKIYYSEEGVKLETVQTSWIFLDGDEYIGGLEYQIIWHECVRVESGDCTIYFDLQLQEPYSVLLNQLKKKGFEVIKNTKKELVLHKENENYSAYYNVSINKKSNVASIEYVDW